MKEIINIFDCLFMYTCLLMFVRGRNMLYFMKENAEFKIKNSCVD